ncbi:hypothetical protein EIN_153280 [Entamoeba invadens IP1]|uniref:Uncharacterized protein n=1 Tax=Entamoeba invadens IP1 TaxID=370355 RepID=A0A0A1UER9_ENTIV|nr:hypothetical protein EIN_153280 [Entamoeba invadens IP1]ELP91321.1 hypothetical protein EIN_153280 [Entamoeba invadens IP1]|eukprot:XP_004258092.1 hypothetical protein EIN_153280 [Entamoeba invadens IP1]
MATGFSNTTILVIVLSSITATVGIFMVGHGCLCFYNQLTTTHPIGDYSVTGLSLICGLVLVFIAFLVFYLYQIHVASSFIIAFLILFIATIFMASVTLVSFMDAYSVKALVKESTSKMMSLEYEFECCGYKTQREYCQKLKRPTCYSRIVNPFMTFRMFCMCATFVLFVQSLTFGIFLCLWFDGIDKQGKDMLTFHISRLD